VVLGCVALIGCGSSRPAAAEREVDPLEVEYGRCAAVLHHEVPTCVLGGERLNLWVVDPDAERVEVWLDDERAEPLRYRREELLGMGLQLEVAAGVSEVRVVLGAERDRRAEWSLRISHGDPTPRMRAAREPIELDVIAGRIPQALQRLEELRAAAPSSTEPLDAALTVAFKLIQDANAPERAESLLREYEALASQSPQGRAELAYHLGLVHWKLGRFDDAAITLREASRYAVRTQDEALELAASAMYADLLAELGYLRAAAHWSQHVRGLLDEREAAPAHVGSASRTLGWIGLLLREAGGDELDPEASYREALRVFGPGGAAPNLDKVGGVRLGLARVALDKGDPREALAQLRQIDPARVTPDEGAHALDLEARALLLQGEGAPVIGSVLDRLEALAAKVDTPQVRWQHAVLRGHLAEREGDVDAAIRSYRRAEELYDEVSQLAVLGVGRSTVGALGPEGTQRLISILVDQERLGEALCTIRLSRARALRALVLPASLDPARREELEDRVRDYVQLERQTHQLEADGQDRPGQELLRARREVQARRQELQRRAVELFVARGQLAAAPTCEDLSARAPGELLLALHPGVGGWILLAEDDLGISAHRVSVSGALSSRSPEELSALLLAPVHEQLRRAKRTRITAVGDAIHIDVHALPFDGAPLVAHTVVSFGVELPRASSPPIEGPPTALLLADATGSLWAASPEIHAAEQHLQHAGWSTRVPADPGSLPQVLGELTLADLFHHAGHADAATKDDAVGLWPPYEGGAPGWPSYLQLEPPATLHVQEILMLARPPRWVVLNGCRTGVLDQQNAGTSLALAFLAAGSEQVLASPEATDDLRVGAIGRQLYEGVAPDEPLDLAVQLQRVQRSLALAGEPVGRVRVWVR
jgi:tetratricopeptide (TPR) repeat protein